MRYTGVGEKRPRELIDTLWNVNIFDVDELALPSAELIDTLWNVNYFSACFLLLLPYELIDTLWNVNSKCTFICASIIKN